VPDAEEVDEEDPFRRKDNLPSIVALVRCIFSLGLFWLVESDDCELSSERGVIFSGDERVELEFKYLLESLRKDTDNPLDLGDCGGSLDCKGCSKFGDELLKIGDVLLELELLLMALPGLFIGE
jgi:hypothetical protein